MFDVSPTTIVFFVICCLFILLIFALWSRNVGYEVEGVISGDKTATFDFGGYEWRCEETLVNLGLDWLTQHWEKQKRPQGDMLEVYYLILFLGDTSYSGSADMCAYNAYVRAIAQAAEQRAYDSILPAEQLQTVAPPLLNFEKLADVQIIKQGLSFLHKHSQITGKKFHKLYVLQLLRELGHLPSLPTEQEIHDAFLNAIATAERALAEKMMWARE